MKDNQTDLRTGWPLDLNQVSVRDSDGKRRFYRLDTFVAHWKRRKVKNPGTTLLQHTAFGAT